MIAIDSRSWGRLLTRFKKPAPSPPRTFSSGTYKSLKNNSAVSWLFIPSLSRFRPLSNPSMPSSTTMRDIPLCFSVGSVLTAVITRSLLIPLVIKVLDPLTTKPLPSLIAVVPMDARSEPMAGSVMAIALMRLPSTRPGIHRSACSSLQ